MKKLILYPALLLLVICANAQCTNAFFPFQEGTSFEQTTYSPKGKEQGKTQNTVTTTSPNKAVVESVILNQKGKQLSQTKYEVVCDNGAIRLDLKNFIPEELLSNYENMKASIEGDFIEFPASLSVGESLPDSKGKIVVELSESGVNMSTEIDLFFTDRQVVAKESITTPAGTFDTYKISQTTVTKMSMLGINRETSFGSTTWIAENVGLVKVENFDAQGKLNSYTLLTKFED